MLPSGFEWVILLVVVVLLFGSKRLPEMARAVGRSARVLRGELKGSPTDDRPGPAEHPTSDSAGRAEGPASDQAGRAEGSAGGSSQPDRG